MIEMLRHVSKPSPDSTKEWPVNRAIEVAAPVADLLGRKTGVDPILDLALVLLDLPGPLQHRDRDLARDHQRAVGVGQQDVAGLDWSSP
ncbi:MAG: hypothetical protein AAF710_00210 [Planctomycetota bacterium]